jgi:predicted  nucleic acid-binding Zn-ribbon protein
MPFAYGSSTNAFNIREAAQAPYRGLTALIQGKPYLVIDKEGDTFVLEGEEGDILKLQHFDWALGSDQDKLVAASRLNDSPFAHGETLGNYTVGRLVRDAGNWFVTVAGTDTLLPLEEMVEILAENRWSKTEFAKTWRTADMGREIKWLVEPDGSVLFEDPSQPVPNHLALIAQQRGRDYVRALQSRPGDEALGIYGAINPQGRIDVGGVLTTDPSLPTPKAYDARGSLVGALKAQDAVQKVYQEAAARGVNVDMGYTIPRVEYGEGVRRIPRKLVSSLSGSFFDHITGDEVEFHELDHFPKDSTTGQQEYWEVQGDDGKTYFIVDGDVMDEFDNVVGNFDPYARPDEDRDLDWYPDWEGPTAKTAASFERNLPPKGIHLRTHEVMRQSGLSATVTYPPGVTSEHPDGFVSQVPGDKNTAFAEMMLTVDRSMEGLGDDMSDVVVRVDTNDDPEAVWSIIEEQGGGAGTSGGRMDDPRMAAPYELSDEEKVALKCPNCGSHTLRAIGVEHSEALMKCLTCGKEFKHDVMGNPESSVKVAIGPNGYFNYPEEAGQQEQVRELLTQIAAARQAGNEQLVQQLQAQLEQMFTTNPGQVNFNNPTPLSSMEKHSPGKEHMKGVSPKRNRQYEHIFDSCRKEHPDWSEDRCKELAARTVNKQRAEKGETKSSVDDCGCDKTAAEDGKHTPGTRVQVEHPKYKGQRGTVIEFKGRDKDLDEEKYHIQLDNGEKVEELSEGHFKKIKSARVANDNLPVTTDNHFFGSMTFETEYSNDWQDERVNDPMYEDTEEPLEATCPMCGGPGTPLGQLGRLMHYRCRNCGADFNDGGGVPFAGYGPGSGERPVGKKSWMDYAKREAARSDYDHWNEDADRMWWEEEGKHPYEPEYDSDDNRDAEDAAWEELDEYMRGLSPDELHEIALGTFSGQLPYDDRLAPDGIKDLAKSILMELPGSDYYGQGDPAEWAERGLRGGKIADKNPAGGWPKSDQPKNPSGLPEVPKFDGNKTKFPYDPPAQDAPYDEPDLSGGDVECPNCRSNAKSMGEFNAREYFRCSNGDCEMEFSYPNSDESQQWGVEDPDELFGQDKPGEDHFGVAWAPDGALLNQRFRGPQNLGDLQQNCPVCGKPAMLNGVCQNCGYTEQQPVADPTEAQGRMSKYVDSTGSDLEEGRWYVMHSSEYKVPDVVRVVTLEDGKLVAHFESDRDGKYPLQLESSDASKYSFDPYDGENDPDRPDLEAVTASGWKLARRNFSQKEQEDLINENPDGRARNFDRLNLEGTHYQIKEESFNILDQDFLWQ